VSVVSGILGFFWQPAWWATKVSAVAVGWIQSVNWIFNAGVGADAVGGDGIVGLTSQQYPNVTASRQYFVMDGDTHVGVQKSAQTWLQMRTSLRNDFNLQPLSSYP
jgi:hypothetical protein